MKKHVNEFDVMKKMLKTVHTIKESYVQNTLNEQNDPQYKNNLNTDTSGRMQSINLNGATISVPEGTELTDEQKKTFQQTIDEFKQQVSDLVEFNSLQIEDKNIQLSGRLIKFDVEFNYIIGGEKSGLFLKGQMIRVDEDFTTMLNQLSEYYKQFEQKWSQLTTTGTDETNQTTNNTQQT